MKNETQRLWYVRLGEQVRGPFPTAAIAQELALGRLPAEARLSSDQVTWASATELEAFTGLLQADASDAWAEERRQALRRWADERQAAAEYAELAPDTRAERRRDHGTQRPAPRPEPRGGQQRTWLVLASLAALLLTLLALAWWLGPGGAPAIKLLK